VYRGWEVKVRHEGTNILKSIDLNLSGHIRNISNFYWGN
jgi:hypothetical protein